ncbi:MAG: hypothetical protein COV10_00925 [Candidatus Vogelbacteria bacterium CG10_big_fil_rev_8_21_14_0_10_51_16]|uniref:Uncharacterized protein n=1 Tax=Candidatus Vogelbacteria bacterium CG10_big_fil_rev_8_21_14_0_10_51_16 TaxID=1975045 RepID=A0A2H0RGC3_9BACT|nr:MAG: hypothetical protein COV10_00925 [Candidatus Vogelbacteria bacterium CG10_big_fil_rev_8_21_14_0_10_51_16]
MVLKIYLDVEQLAVLAVFLASQDNRIDNCISIDHSPCSEGTGEFASLVKVRRSGEVVLRLAESYRWREATEEVRKRTHEYCGERKEEVRPIPPSYLNALMKALGMVSEVR